jgi:hypothetical protein
MNTLADKLFKLIDEDLTDEVLELMNHSDISGNDLAEGLGDAFYNDNPVLIEAFMSHPNINISYGRNYVLVQAAKNGELEICERILNHPTFNNNIFAHPKETKHPVKQMIKVCSRKQDPPATLIESIITKFTNSDLYFEDNWLLKYCYKHNNQKLIDILLENETVKANLLDMSIFESLNEKNIVDFKTC